MKTKDDAVQFVLIRLPDRTKELVAQRADGLMSTKDVFLTFQVNK